MGLTAEAAAALIGETVDDLARALTPDKHLAQMRPLEIEAIVGAIALATRQMDATTSDAGRHEIAVIALTLGEVLYVLGRTDERRAMKAGGA